MSILNAKSNLFVLQFPRNFFYPEIREKWTPVINRLQTPYSTIEDYVNACIQSISFPAINIDTVSQGQGQFKVHYRPGKELNPIFDRSLDITFKLSESYYSYWILFEQFEKYLSYNREHPIYWPSMHLLFLDHHGFNTITFKMTLVVPTGLSSLNLSYASIAADYNTFTLNVKYNDFEILYLPQGLNLTSEDE